MKYFVLFFFLLPRLVFSQCEDSDKLETGGSHLSKSKNYIPFAYIPQNASDSISYGIDIHTIKKYSDFILDKAEQYIINRANKDFYSRLEFDQVEVNYLNTEIKDYENRELYELSNFDYTYWMLYTYRYENIKYVFGLEFNKDGKMISENMFPKFSEDKDSELFTGICDALASVKGSPKFKNKKVDFIELSYIDEVNSFCWLIKEKIALEIGVHNYSVNLYYVNANTNKLVNIKKESGSYIACGMSKIKLKKGKKKKRA
ncbi:hypothetical protein Q765_20350 [Flavobacterium rivuli WB 3.3-2 = DSM 21788]|uniref:Uncharacterized protein n=1 Tax=Flavobacterium rivuli WB 3.3-2 = DSM 21788 TaxID=1121895 RepID=A0A0A2LXL0_9FLAO|nr:hypothetical protein [Flavobacterium rivuli]KGO84704.1 hypothetical protein Q765_20350 [Flavobacterium rivuli WB 3.3-2 = DSM 21788]